MSHRGLCRSRRNAGATQERSEGVPQGVNVDTSPPFVALGDCRRSQVPVENTHKARDEAPEARVGHGTLCHGVRWRNAGDDVGDRSIGGGRRAVSTEGGPAAQVGRRSRAGPSLALRAGVLDKRVWRPAGSSPLPTASPAASFMSLRSFTSSGPAIGWLVAPMRRTALRRTDRPRKRRGSALPFVWTCPAERGAATCRGRMPL